MSHISPLIEQDIKAYLAEHERKDLLRFITCGSVDDGKSTLIGRLLHDTNMIFDDHMAALNRDSKRHGTVGEEVDLALLVDGLQSEREQGITIDVAYRYFSTEKRKFIIADTPGHEQYTRNMATGASTANLAVILVDARHGLLTQTRRHSFIVSLLGIKHAVIAINKMDLVDYDQTVYEKIKADYEAFATGLGITDIQFVPLSALKGDNIVNKSTAMDWYKGPTLLDILENVDVTQDTNFRDLRFPVQYVNRPNLNFRGFCGTLAAGVVKKGDAVMALPSRKKSRVKSIVTYEGEQESAFAPLAVTLTLEDEIDISRGDMLVQPDRAPYVEQVFDAHIIWMNEKPLLPGKQYDFKIGTKTTSGIIETIHHDIDINTLEKQSTNQVGLNHISLCRIHLSESVAFDPYEVSQATGSFIIIDKLTNGTYGAGVISEVQPQAMADKSENVVWHKSKVNKQMRANQKGQKPCVLWFTGLSGSGKSTIANALEQRLLSDGYHTYLLDGDNIRHGLNKDLDFTDEGRVENIRRIGEVARLMADAGLIVITAFISPFRSDRALVRELLDEGEFIEVHVDTPLDICEQRDPKGLYKKARAGEIGNFTGIDSPYEAPVSPEIRLNTRDNGPDKLAVLILKKLKILGIITQ